MRYVNVCSKKLSLETAATGWFKSFPDFPEHIFSNETWHGSMAQVPPGCLFLMGKKHVWENHPTNSSSVVWFNFPCLVR